MDNVIDFTKFKDMKDLKQFTNALYHQVVKLQTENEDLKNKIKHLEELLLNCTYS